MYDRILLATDGTEASTDAATHASGGPDRYCGTCTHFRYDNGTTPVCGFHERQLDDLDPCPDFER